MTTSQGDARPEPKTAAPSRAEPRQARPRPPAPPSGAVLPTGAEFLARPRKAIALFGMSGVGKTRLANRLRKSGGWFHYSVDYRIGTRYLDEAIVDQFKREAMKSPLLREMLLSDSVRLESNIRFENLAPLSAYLGKPGDPARGGLCFDEYIRRQRQHREAEVMAMLDAPVFMEKAEAIYGYPHFLCDTSGSLVEVVDVEDPEDPIMTTLSQQMLFVFLRGEKKDEEELVRRFESDPKPIYYDEDFLRRLWDRFQEESPSGAGGVDPDAFARYSFRSLIGRRAPRYQTIADRWGVTLAKDAVEPVEDEAGLIALIAEALDARGRKGASSA